MEETFRTKMSSNGRVLIPSQIRKSLDISDGEEIIMYIKDFVLHITTPDAALKQLRQSLKAKNIKGSMVDELLEMRREEVRREEEQYEKYWK